MQKLSERQIEVAVEWWSKAIENPRFDNGDRSEQGFMASMVAKLANTNTPSTSEKGIAFAKHLRASLESGLDGWCLAVDYHPEGQLAESALAAGIGTDLTSWPWKTTMWFERGGVQVKQGYGAPTQTLLDDTD